MIRYTMAGVLAFGAMGLAAQAADVKAPFELENTKVLPKGVRNPRVKDLMMWVDSRYDGGGGTLSLGSKLNKRVTWNDVINAQEDEISKAQVEGALLAAGVDKTGYGAGDTTGVVNTYANVIVPVLGWGVSEKLTLAAALPVYNVKVEADTGFKRSADGQTFVSYLGSTNPVKASEAAGKLNDAINSKLKRLGYEQISDLSVKGIGDAKLVGKYAAWSDSDNSIALKTELTLPTGREANPDRALDVPTGDGQADLGASVIYDRKIGRDFRWNSYLGYTFQFIDDVERRLPVSETDTLSADKDTMKRNLGDLLSTGTSLSYEFERLGLSLGTGYSFQFMGKTTYAGSRYAQYRYRLLENEAPLQSLHAATAMLGFSTVNFFKAKKFPLPFQTNLSYSKPIVGRNVTKNDVFAGELVLFF